MSIQSKTILKSYFQVGDRPTQQQFANLIDSLAHVTDINTFNEFIPVDESIASADIGKLAMLDYDGVIKLYQESPGYTGVKGKWKIKFNSLSQNYTTFKFVDAKDTLSIGVYNWLNGASTTAEEASNFKTHLQNNYATVFLTSDGDANDEVIIEQVRALNIDVSPEFEMGDTSITTLVNPSPTVATAAKRICVGLIKSVNETNHSALFDDIMVMQADSAPDISAALTDAATENFGRHLFTLIRLVGIPTNGGKLKPIDADVVENDPSWILNNIHNLMYFFIKPHATSGKYYVLKRGLG